MDPNNTHEVIFWDNLYKLRPWLFSETAEQNSRKLDRKQDLYQVCIFGAD